MANMSVQSVARSVDSHHNRKSADFPPELNDKSYMVLMTDSD
jgi:hypothetical protein